MANLPLVFCARAVPEHRPKSNIPTINKPKFFLWSVIFKKDTVRVIFFSRFNIGSNSDWMQKKSKVIKTGNIRQVSWKFKNWAGHITKNLFKLLGRGFYRLSGWQDSNLRPPHPKCGAIPGYATPRIGIAKVSFKITVANIF